MEFIELRGGESPKTAYCNGHNLVRLYSSLSETKFGKLKYFVKYMLFAFGSTYICEQMFSIIQLLNSKYASQNPNWPLERYIDHFYIKNQTYDQ